MVCEELQNGEVGVTEPEVILRIEDLRVSYGKLRAVDGLNLTVRAGEIYGFLGRNGAGKTTAIRAMMGIITPARGRIELLGYRGRRIRARQKQRIGYVSQEQHFYPWMSCRALGRFVSGFYPTWDHDEFARLLSLLDLPPKRRVSHLSGGMRVKLALALALAHRPPILILDEPTSGLDPATRREFLEIISRQARSHSRTTFFSSHLVDEVERVADRVGIIHNGGMRYEGDIRTLQESVREVDHLPPTDGPGTADVGANEPTAGDAVESAVDDPSVPVTAELAVDTYAARWEFCELAAARGFVVMRDGFSGNGTSSVVYGDPEAWRDVPFGTRKVRRLSLEDIFIAMTAEATPNL
ncbi:MAG: ABC transporter ATP-binding protein [Planctomycetaceae bacterium]|nr:ABC transporter ATP-binding protein [Planctomycetaceae bacterium]